MLGIVQIHPTPHYLQQELSRQVPVWSSSDK